MAYYPPATITASYDTINVIGAALPSNLGLTKAAVVPLTTLLAWLILRVRRIALAEFTPLDGVMAGFCLWPLAGALLRGSDIATALGDALYLSASWGASWALARGLFRRPEDWLILLRGVAWSGVAMLPMALLECVPGPWLYPAVWGRHAFLLEGEKRTFGYRPLGFFEHGNQYAIWLASAAFAWLVLAKLDALKPRQWIFAVATISAVVAAQSVAGIVLLSVAAFALLVPPRIVRRSVLACGAAIGFLGVIYISGLLPADRLAHSAAFSHRVTARFDPIRLHSLLSRMKRDQVAIPLLRSAPLTGTGQWDWWRSVGTHPWGLLLLVVGQFGAVSLLLLLTALLTPPVTALFRQDARGFPFALLVLIGAFDAVLNSFVYFPAVLFAAALVGNGRPTGKAVGRERHGGTGG